MMASFKNFSGSAEGSLEMQWLMEREKSRGGGEDRALVGANVECTGAGWSPFSKVCIFWLSGRPSCVNERCKQNETWLFLLLRIVGVDHRIRAPSPLIL